MILENYIPNNKVAFLSRLQVISNSLGIKPEWLMIVMMAESSLKPNARNSITKATGLIQFMPSTAIGIGTTVDQLYVMTNVQQLDWVYKYFKPYAHKMHSVSDLYLVTFFPAALGKADNWIMQTSKLSSKLIAKQNPGIDINKNLEITVGEFKQYVANFIKKKLGQSVQLV